MIALLIWAGIVIALCVGLAVWDRWMLSWKKMSSQHPSPDWWKPSSGRWWKPWW